MVAAGLPRCANLLKDVRQEVRLITQTRVSAKEIPRACRPQQGDLMDDTRTAVRRTGNGRSDAENTHYAAAAALAIPRPVQIAKAAGMRQARRAKIAAEIDPDGTMDPAQLEHEIRLVIRGQFAKARALTLTAQRKAAKASEASLAARREAKEAAKRAAEAEKAEAAVRRELA
jgi:hypothetical protein